MRIKPCWPKEDIAELKRVWSQLDKDSCPKFYNFHMHTNCSDGKLEPLALIEQAIEIGLKGLAITDHHSIKACQVVQNYLQKQNNPDLPCFWSGLEITAQLIDIEVHILAYGFSIGDESLIPYLQGDRASGDMALAGRVIENIHNAGGLAVLAHPVRYNHLPEELIARCHDLGIDGVETFYAYGNPKPWQPSSKETELVMQLTQKYNLFNTCGTDSHGLSLLQRI
ncbi:MAG: PHP domain-containing protein [Cyanobacteriota bacterium ELA615]|jgi:hypothetical protein